MQKVVLPFCFPLIVQALQGANGNMLVGLKTYDIRMNPAYEEAFYTVE